MARQRADFFEEKRLTKEIKKSAALDRSVWLDDLLASGDWQEIRKLKKGVKHQQGRLKNIHGQLVSSEIRANTLAEHLEKIQWAVRATTIPDMTDGRQIRHDELPIKTTPITLEELFAAAKMLKRKRAPGLDSVPAEFWKAILTPGSCAVAWALRFCNLCWDQKKVPRAWHEAKVAMLFKKGDPSECDNYRPISLLSIGYKLFALILLNRLREAGAEDRLWPTQFGFWRGLGTGDGLFIVRRVIEEVWAKKNGSATLLALN